MPTRYRRIVPSQMGHGVFRGVPYQWGTGYPPYRNFQEGEGIGNIFRSVMRFLLPIIAPIATQTASKFVTSTAERLKEGESLGKAAKHSIAPALGSALEGTTEQVMAHVRKATQGGTGRKRRRRGHVATSKAKRRRRARRKTTSQTGGKRRRRRVRHLKKQVGGRRKGVYKRRRRKRSRKTNPFQFLKSNF